MERIEEYIPQLSELDELRAKILNTKPSVDESLEYIYSELTPQFIYNCNALSGSKISKENTRRIVANGPGDNERDLKSVKEIVGLHKAYGSLLEMSRHQLSTEKLQELHKTLHGCIDETTAGLIKESKTINYPRELRDFAFWFNNNDLDAISFAAEAYGRYIFLHPFKGSNGRMARLIMNLAFLKRQYPVVIIPSKWKHEYERIMDGYSNEEFAKFVRKCIFFSQNLIINKKGNLYSENKKRHIRGLIVDDQVYEHVNQNPGCKATEIKKDFPKISFTKLQRILRALSADGKIEFRGPTKTGGYYSK